jgi:alkanesulfonate monooxygenase SsuD/methylene tetrahydromethanopterin reductase-like flavin-dependent oxidoreductase (luciferase family)
VEDKKQRFMGPILEAKSRHPTRWIRELPIEEYVDRRFLMGTPAECAEKLSGFIKHGCDRLNFVFPDAREIKPLQVFAENVISRFK